MKYPETELDNWTNISEHKMFGTGMWFMRSAYDLTKEAKLLEDADLCIKLTDIYLERLSVRAKTLEELKKERLKALDDEFDYDRPAHHVMED